MAHAASEFESGSSGGRTAHLLPSLKRIHLVGGVLFGMVTLAFASGRTVLFREDAERAYSNRVAVEIRLSAIEASQQRTDSGLVRLEGKVDRVLEALATRP